MKIEKQIRNTSFLTIVLSAMFFVGCTDYLDVNQDTDNPTTPYLPYLLSGTQRDLSDIGDYNVNGGQNYSVYVHQMCDRGSADQYNLRADDANSGNDWSLVYSTLRNINSLIAEATSKGNLIYAGIGQLEKAYVMSVAVDLWGDVPYSEAGLINDNLLNPKFDNQKLVYSQVFALIDSGIANLASGGGSLKPSAADDLIYKGDKAKWTKFAKTLKLKLYNQTRLTSDFDQVGFDALIAAGGFMLKGDDFQFLKNNKTSTNSGLNERNRLYIDSYESSQFGSYISPWFYEILKGVNPNIHTGTPDPRMKYMIYNQIGENAAAPPDNGVVGGNPKADYWDKATGFFSIRFCSSSPYRDSSQENSYSYPGIYPCGGAYKVSVAGNSVASANSGGKGLAPRRMLTFDEFLFIQAELIQSGKIAGGDAAALVKLEAAIKANFQKIDDVVTKSLTTDVVPVLATSTGATAFITKIKTEYNAAISPAKKLEIIMTQKWIATFGDPVDQYTDFRRTGFPILHNPNSSIKEFQLNNGDAFPLSDALTNLVGQYQQSLFWPQQEINTNLNAPTQKTATSYKIFWAN